MKWVWGPSAGPAGRSVAVTQPAKLVVRPAVDDVLVPPLDQLRDRATRADVRRRADFDVAQAPDPHHCHFCRRPGKEELLPAEDGEITRARILFVR